MKNIVFLISILYCFASCKNNANQTENTSQIFVLNDKMMATTTFTGVSKNYLKNEITLYGKITPDNNKLIDIYPVVGGNVIKVFVELGDYVHKGQILASIKSTEIAGFEKDLEDAKNDLIVATNNARVAKDLYEGKLSSEKDFLEAKNKLEKAQSQLHRIQEIYQIYNIQQGAIYEVRSPLNGFIIQKNINQDMLLRNDKSDNIFDIAEIQEIWAIANVNESDIRQVKLGIDADVTTLSYADKVFHGKVNKIFSVIDPETKAMQICIKLHNPNNLLKPEMRASIKLHYTENQKMIAVPSNAIVFDKSKNFVMVFKDRNNIETRQVQVFRQVNDITYINSGLDENEKIITNNQLLIYDAMND